MTTPLDSLSLLDLMDAAADLLRTANCDYAPADDVLIFRKLQREPLEPLTISSQTRIP
jgi:hypothetical protein